MKFTAKLIASVTLPKGKTDCIFWSDWPKGFGLRLRLDGNGRVSKNFIVQYRTDGRRTRRMQLGDAEVRGLDSALKEAKAILGKVAEGKDPAGERRQERQKVSDTLKSVVTDYLEAKRPEVRRNTYRELVRYLRGPSFQPLHATSIDKITRKDVAVQLVKIGTEVSSVTANRARTALSAFFSWAMGAGLVEQNPVVGTNVPKGSIARDRTLNDRELAAVWNASGDGQFGAILRLLILLGQRRQEVGGMRWSEIGADGSIWRLPPERTKNHRAHTLPLPQSALDIIATVPQIAGRDYLFGVHGRNGFRDWWEGKLALDARLGDQVAEWKIHDIRRSVATGMADIGIQPHVIEQILNHVSGHKGGIAGIYNRSSYEREVRAALALWADHVRTLVEGGERKVLQFPTAS
jgi:integrase